MAKMDNTERAWLSEITRIVKKARKTSRKARPRVTRIKAYEIAIERAKVNAPMWLSTKELAAVFGVHEDTIYRWLKLGAPHYSSPAGFAHKMFVLDEILTWLKNGDRPSE